MPVRDQNGLMILDHDEHMRPDTTMEGLAKLKTAFDGIGSMGGFDDSTKVTAKPFCRTAMAAAQPAGPPPTIKMSDFTTSIRPVRSRIPVPWRRAGSAFPAAAGDS